MHSAIWFWLCPSWSAVRRPDCRLSVKVFRGGAPVLPASGLDRFSVTLASLNDALCFLYPSLF